MRDSPAPGNACISLVTNGYQQMGSPAGRLGSNCRGSPGVLELPLARFHELAEVDSVLDDVAAAHGRVLVIEGAPGLGKTVLLGETARRAAARGFSVGSVRARAPQRELPGFSLRTALERLDGRRPSDDLERELSRAGRFR